MSADPSKKPKKDKRKKKAMLEALQQEEYQDERAHVTLADEDYEEFVVHPAEDTDDTVPLLEENDGSGICAKIIFLVLLLTLGLAAGVVFFELGGIKSLTGLSDIEPAINVVQPETPPTPAGVAVDEDFFDDIIEPSPIQTDAPKDSELPETLAEPATLEEIDQVVTEVDDLTETVTEPAADVSEEPVEEVIETATQVPVENSENFETHLEDEPAEVPSESFTMRAEREAVQEAVDQVWVLAVRCIEELRALQVVAKTSMTHTVIDTISQRLEPLRSQLDDLVKDTSESVFDGALEQAAELERSLRVVLDELDQARNQDKILAEEAARQEEERAAREAEEQAAREAEERAAREAEEKAAREAEEKAAREAEERAAREAEERAAREAEERAAREAEERAAREAEEKSAREAAELAAREAEERAIREAEERAAREAEERAAREAQERAAREAAELAAREAEERAIREAEERAAREAAELAAREAEERAAREAAELAAREAEERAIREAEEKAIREAEERAARVAEERAVREAEELAARQEEDRIAREQEALAAEVAQSVIDELEEMLAKSVSEEENQSAEAAAEVNQEPEIVQPTEEQIVNDAGDSTEQPEENQRSTQVEEPIQVATEAFVVKQPEELNNNNIPSRMQNLEEADRLVDQSPAQALSLMEQILEKDPANALALYGRARSLDSLAEVERSNGRLEQSIFAYRAVLDLEDQVDDELFLKSALRCIDRMRFRGFHSKSIRIQQRLVSRFPHHIEYQNQLAVGFLLTNQPEAARSVLERVLERWPHSGFAQVHLGFILKTTFDDYEAGARWMLSGIATREEGVIDGRFYSHLGDALARLGKNQEAQRIYAEGEKEGVFRSRDQRSLYNVDRLTGQPWWTKESTTYGPFFDLLEANWLQIRDEGVALLSLESPEGFTDESEKLRDSGGWKQYELFAQGRKNVAHCNKAPVTCTLIENYPPALCKRGQVKFSIMHPGTHVWPHTGPTNCRIRSHLGLVVPGGAELRVGNITKTWEEGKFIIFDDSFDHEVWHNGPSYRLVLIVDLWHPELTQDEWRSLAPI